MQRNTGKNNKGVRYRLQSDFAISINSTPHINGTPSNRNSTDSVHN